MTTSVFYFIFPDLDSGSYSPRLLAVASQFARCYFIEPVAYSLACIKDGPVSSGQSSPFFFCSTSLSPWRLLGTSGVSSTPALFSLVAEHLARRWPTTLVVDTTTPNGSLLKAHPRSRLVPWHVDTLNEIFERKEHPGSLEPCKATHTEKQFALNVDATHR